MLKAAKVDELLSIAAPSIHASALHSIDSSLVVQTPNVDHFGSGNEGVENGKVKVTGLCINL